MKRLRGLLACSPILLGLADPAQSAVTIGSQIVVASTGDVIATYLGSNASYEDQVSLGTIRNFFDNQLSLVGSTFNLGTYTAGTVLTFSLNVLTTGQTYYSGAASANPDGVAHASVDSTASPAIIAFEDMFGGGDRDYNDLRFSLTNVTSAVPEPLSWAMFLGGFGLIGGAARRRRLNVNFA